MINDSRDVESGIVYSPAFLAKMLVILIRADLNNIEETTSLKKVIMI